MSRELPKGWSAEALGHLTSKIGSGATPRGGERAYKTHGTPLIRSMNVHFTGFRKDGLAFLNEDQARALDGVTVQPDDVLLNITGASIGRVTQAPNEMENARVNQHVCIIRPLDGISPAFVSRYLSSPRMQVFVAGENYGVTRQALTKEMIEGISLPVPPLAEQHRIVAKIDSLFARSSRARDELAHIPKLIERYRQAVLEAAFRGDLTADWRAGNHCGPARDLSVDDLVSEPTRNGLSVRGSDDPPGVPALRLSALRGAEVDLSDIRFLPITDQQAKRYLLKAGDVLISRGNGTKRLVARASLVPAVTTAVIFPDTAFRVRLSSNRANAEWFSLIWNAPQVRQQIENLAKTTAGIWKVSQSDISAVVLRVPDVTEQAEVVNKVRTMMAGIDNFEREMLRATGLIDRLDASILDKAFTGRLVPQDPNDEPASKLLERIRAARAAAPAVKRGRKAKAAADGGLF